MLNEQIWNEWTDKVTFNVDKQYRFSYQYIRK